jgi:hypothetical protein
MRTILLLLCLATPAFAAHPYDAACKVVVQRTARRVVGGSGVLIAVNDTQALVLTVKHVALTQGRAATCWWGEQECPGTVLATAPDADVALLLVKRPAGIRPALVAMPSAETGPFVLVGFPGHDRDTMRWQQGEWISLDHNHLAVACAPEKGMSGGPCFDRYGRVVGTVSSFNLTDQRGACGSGQAMFNLIDDYMKVQR